MQVHFINTEGRHVYSGDIRNPKVASLPALGFVKVPTAPPSDDESYNYRWVGAAWVLDPPPPPDPATTPNTVDDLVRLLLSKGLFTQAELDTIKRGRPA